MSAPIHLAGLDATDRYAKSLADQLRPGDAIALIGTLGAGKTHLAKCLVAALGSAAHVTSPTFALVNEYSDGEVPVAHFDFYRIGSEQELIDLGWDDYDDGETILIVEWANRFPALMPAHTRWLELTTVDEKTRSLSELETAPAKHLDD